MKKQLIVLIAVLAAAVLLFGAYFIFFRADNNETPTESFYSYSKAADAALSAVTDKNVTVSFAESASVLAADEYKAYAYDFVRSLAHDHDYITVETGKGGDFAVVSCGDSSKSFALDDFFNAFENGTKYSFRGEEVYCNAILDVTGNGSLTHDAFLSYGIGSYDADGDTVGTSNRPFVYPNITRSDIKEIKITNSYGGYRLYRSDTDNGLYFSGAELCSYDQEKFSSFIVNCTYMLAIGKVSDPLELSAYGLDSEANATAVIEINTVDGKYHKILIGTKLQTSGSGYYYAKYYTKDTVYLLDTSIESDILKPLTVMLTANLGYSISSNNDTYEMDNIVLNYTDPDMLIYVTQKADLAVSENVAQANAEQALTTVLHDKTYFNGTYTTKWTSDETLAGVATADGEIISFTLQPENYALDNQYEIRFGLVRDTANNAELPSEAYVEVYDSDSKSYVRVAELKEFDQGDKSFHRYAIPYTYEKAVASVRLSFVAPKKTAGKYMVLDEITAYADGRDAIPNESVAGIWKVLSPSSVIYQGYNYATPDPSTFSEIVYGMATLVGDEVVEYNVDSSETLKKYGLETPRLMLSYEFKGYTSYIYLSAADANGDYYAYSTISYSDKNDKVTTISSGIIAKIYKATAAWIGWSPLDFVDRGVFQMYIDKIDSIEMEFDGKTYLFELHKNDAGTLSSVTCDGKEVDLANFRYLYVSVLNCTRAGSYEKSDSDTPTKLFRFSMKSTLKDVEIIFYRVTSNKVYYERNGEPSNYYVLYSDVSIIMQNVMHVLNGEEIPHRS